MLEAGVEITEGDFLQNTYPHNYFECIRLEHVFEHLHEPSAVLEKLYGMLKPGGVLVMNFPGIQGFGFVISPRHCELRDSPRHLFLHSEKSVRNMVVSAGFKPRICKQYAVAQQFGATLNNILKQENKKIPSVVFSVFSPIYRLFGKLVARGEFITVLAEK